VLLYVDDESSCWLAVRPMAAEELPRRRGLLQLLSYCWLLLMGYHDVRTWASAVERAVELLATLYVIRLLMRSCHARRGRAATSAVAVVAGGY
jgi:hypothetical protein